MGAMRNGMMLDEGGKSTSVCTDRILNIEM